MDIAGIRTFLAVMDTGSFVAAAERVNVTQSTVSMRIRALEEQVGARLFERNKKGALATPGGREFAKHALAIARIWDQARLEVGVTPKQRALLRVGSQHSLWAGYLIDWLVWMRANVPEVAIRSEVGHTDSLTQHIADGSLDLAVMYRPQHRPGMRVRKLFNDEIILVAAPTAADDPLGPNYVFVDWGPEFQKDHALNFPELDSPSASLDLGVMGIDYLTAADAAGYFPSRAAEAYIDEGSLVAPEVYPTFSYPVYGVFPDALDPALADTVMTGLKHVAEGL